MTVSTYEQWKADGAPWRNAPVIETFAELMRRHGYTVYTIGNSDHLTAAVPEDHTPYSHTPWPGPQPYPLVLALDVMPGGPVNWRLLGYKIVADRHRGLPGTEWIKYVNWTDEAGNCFHTSWEPDFAGRPSTDTGHIHISARTDYAALTDLRGWDPVAALLAGGMPVPTPQPLEDPVLSNWTTVRKGDTGDRVKVVEGLLLAHGLPVGCDPNHLDGIAGRDVDASIRALQSRYGITVDGQFGPHTLSVAVVGRDVAA